MFTVTKLSSLQCDALLLALISFTFLSALDYVLHNANIESTQD